MHPLLSLNLHAMQSSLLDCLKSLSRSLMIHATVLSRPWPCNWVKDVQSVNQTHEINSIIFKPIIQAFRSYKIWSCNEISKILHCFRPLSPLVLSAPLEHAPVELDGKDTQLKWCWTVSKDSDSPHHFYVDLSFWDKFDTLVQRQPALQKCSKLLPAKHPFQQVGKSCKELQLATPAFAHGDTYRKINQSVDSGHLSIASKRAAHPVSKSRQKKHVDCWRHERYLSMHPLLSLDRCAHLKVSFLNPIERIWKTHSTSVSRCLYCPKFHWCNLDQRCCSVNRTYKLYLIQSPKILEATQSGRVAKLHIQWNLHFRPLPPLVLLSSASDRTPVEVRKQEKTQISWKWHYPF